MAVGFELRLPGSGPILHYHILWPLQKPFYPEAGVTELLPSIPAPHPSLYPVPILAGGCKSFSNFFFFLSLNTLDSLTLSLPGVLTLKSCISFFPLLRPSRNLRQEPSVLKQRSEGWQGLLFWDKNYFELKILEKDRSLWGLAVLGVDPCTKYS